MTFSLFIFFSSILKNNPISSNQKGKPQTPGTKNDKEKKQTADLCILYNVQNSKIQSSSIFNIPLSRPQIGFDNAYVVSSTTWLSSCINFGLHKETSQVELKLPNRNSRSLDPIYIQSAPYSTLFFFYNKILEFEERRIVFRDVRGSALLLNSFSE